MARRLTTTLTRQRGYQQMATAGVIWGTIGPAAALVAEHTPLDALQTSFWRLLIAVVPMTALALILNRSNVRPTRGLLLFALLVGAFTGSSQLAYFAAVADSGIAIPTLVACGLGPILTAAGQTVLFKERPDQRTLVAMATALLGLALLVLGGPADVTVRGVLLSVVSAVTYAIYTLAAGPASRRMDVTTLNAAAIAGGALAMLPFVLATGGPGVADSVIGWVALLHLGLVVSGLAYVLYFSAARTLPPTHITLLALLEPLVAALIAVAFFDEALTVGVIVGGVLMLGAVAVLRETPDAEPHPPPA
jgi:DME family drug/metabolite transporter